MRLNSIRESDKNKFKKIAKNDDMSMGLFLKKEIRKIVDKYPNEIKDRKIADKCVSIRVSNISPKIAKQFENIAHNKGLTTSQLLTLHSDEIINSYPSWMVRFEE